MAHSHDAAPAGGFAPPGGASRRMSIRTNDVDEARAISEQVFYANSMVVFDRAAFDFRLTSVQVGPVTVGMIRNGTDVHFDCYERGTAYQLDLGVAGSATGRCGDQRATIGNGMAAISNPEGRSVFDHWTPDCVLLGVKIDRAFMEHQLRVLTGEPSREPLRFRMAVPTRATEHQPWLSLVRALASLLPSSTDDAMVDALGGVPEALVTALLATVPNSHSERIERAAERSEPAAVRRAAKAMREQPERSWTPQQLAALSGVGVRALQAGFQRTYDRGISRFLRELRLDQVRAELLRGERLVSDVAADYGFNHLGRFSAYYAERFGEQPRATRRRAQPIGSAARLS